MTDLYPAFCNKFHTATQESEIITDMADNDDVSLF